MKHYAPILVAALLLTTAACDRPSEPRYDNDASTPAMQVSAEDAEADIRAANERWEQLASARDFETLVQMYSEDAIVITPEEVLRGRDAILADFQKGADDEEPHTSSVTSDRIEVAASGDLAYVFGSWTAGSYTGHYLSVLENRNGEWVWVADAWNEVGGED